MSFLVEMKSLAAKAFYVSGLVETCLKTRRNGSFFILMYHRVMPQENLANGLQPGMYVEKSNFERQVVLLMQHFHIIPLSRVCSHSGTGHGTAKKAPCVLTFDDGWVDFFQYVFPVLKKYQVPATVFLPTKYIGSHEWFWTDILSSYYAQKYTDPSYRDIPGASSNPIIDRLENLDGSLEQRIEKAIAVLKNLGEEDIRRIMSELKLRWNIVTGKMDRAFLSWQEVKEMAVDGLVSFGSHTVTHNILTGLSGKNIMEELVASKEKLISEGAADPSFIPFCYPNGNHNEQISEMVKKAGYHTAVTTVPGWNNRKTCKFRLRRIAIHQDMTFTDEMFACRIARIL